MRFMVKLWNHGELAKKDSSSKQRIVNFIKKHEFNKAYMKVIYNKIIDCWGRKAEAYNDGEYTDRRELMSVFQVFVNEGR